ncbi:MAG TPA: hypothetical protein VL053_03710 [Arachidicoccus sp.]|nr:hypothetical protein [Arachidicoccus sp.]
MKKIKFYLPKGTINDATEYYCKLIERAFIMEGFNVVWTVSINEIDDGDNLLTIRAIDLVSITANTKFTINWFQGIISEECKLLYSNPIKRFLFSKYYGFKEKKALSRANLCLFVSERMCSYYESKYKLTLKRKSIVIPCYNLPLNPELILSGTNRYRKLSFVYAGGLFAWQCIDETLLIFKEINKLNSNAELVILTGEQEEARKLVERLGLTNVIVKHVDLDKLQSELAKYKYGFLVRKEHIVNNVATPTKMNSYLAAGLIPIYTTVIDSFEKNINLEEFTLKVSNTESYLKIAKKIIAFDNSCRIAPTRLLDVYQKVFSSYYNDDLYMNELSKSVKMIY